MVVVVVVVYKEKGACCWWIDDLFLFFAELGVTYGAGICFFRIAPVCFILLRLGFGGGRLTWNARQTWNAAAFFVLYSRFVFSSFRLGRARFYFVLCPQRDRSLRFPRLIMLSKRLTDVVCNHWQQLTDCVAFFPHLSLSLSLSLPMRE